jgi:hypothetical protein
MLEAEKHCGFRYRLEEAPLRGHLPASESAIRGATVASADRERRFVLTVHSALDGIMGWMGQWLTKLESGNPSERWTFRETAKELRHRKYKILPEVDDIEVERYYRRVRDIENRLL